MWSLFKKAKQQPLLPAKPAPTNTAKPAPTNSGSVQLPMVTSPDQLGRVDLPRLTGAIQALGRQTRAREPRNIPLSAFVVVYNEMPVVELSLLSLWCCQELIVIDKGSTDGSLETSTPYATKILKVAWSPVVEDTRAAADEACTRAWRIFLDADEFLTPEAVALVRGILARDAAGDFPFDAVALPRVNHVFGQCAERNCYRRGTIVRMYRQGIYRHIRSTHSIVIAEGARVFTAPLAGPAAVVHFNQDHIFEYLEKLNRYTETYVTRYPPPQSAEEIYDFALRKLLEARQGTLALGNAPYDAACDLLTAIYFVVEYLKQWQRDRHLSVDRHYEQVLRDIFVTQPGAPQ